MGAQQTNSSLAAAVTIATVGLRAPGSPRLPPGPGNSGTEDQKLNKSLTKIEPVVPLEKAPDEHQVYFKQDGTFPLSSIKIGTLEPNANWRFHLLAS